MTLTRRTALAAPALLALPSAALAGQAEPDPAVAAFEAWRAAHIARRHADEPTFEFVECPPDLAAVADAALRREMEAMRDLIDARPSTAAGLAHQLRAIAFCAGFDWACDHLPVDPVEWRPDLFTDLDGDAYEYEALAIRGLWGAVAATEAMAAPR